MTENSLYTKNQLRPCHITPEELEISEAKTTLFEKPFRKELNAIKSRIQHQREMALRQSDHSSIDHTFAGITIDSIISPEHCRTLAKAGSINLQGHWIGAEGDTKTPVVKVSGDPTGSNRNHCKTKGWISRVTFIIHMQKKTTLKVMMENGKVLSDIGLMLPCALRELGCETTSLNPYAYFWDYPDIYVLSMLWAKDANVVKQGTKYYASSGKDSAYKFVFKVRNNPAKIHFGKPTTTYPTNYDSI